MSLLISAEESPKNIKLWYNIRQILEGNQMIGRVAEIQELRRAYASEESEFVASSGLKSGKYNGNIMAVVTGDDLFARQAH